MKILQRGTKPKTHDWEGRYLCAYCRSVFRLTEDDADFVLDWDDDQRDGISVRIHCPVCDQDRSLMQLEKTTTYTENRAAFDGLEDK